MKRLLIPVAAALLLPHMSLAEPLTGRLVDTLTHTPITGAHVAVRGTTLTTFTDDEGRYRFDLEPGFDYTLDIEAPLPAGAPTERLSVVRQRAGASETVVPVLTMAFAASGEPVAQPYGLPSTSGHFDVPSEGPVDLLEFARARPNPLALTMPTPLPATIKVGRRFTGNCRDAAVSQIDELPLEEYVKGVVYAEVGVFGAVPPRDVAAVETWKAFAIAARSYALYWYVRDPDASTNGYHLDDTACKQRYLDTRDPEVSAAVDDVAGLVLIQKGTASTFDQFEYAASCGEHGSRPEYDTIIIPDAVPGEACAGSWCGHNDCAAHEDNPNVAGDDRCLVRGVCQWGSVERSMNGATYLEILDHYQPNLEVRNFAILNLSGTVRDSDPASGALLEGVEVTLDGDTTTLDTTSADGVYLFEDVEPGAHTVRFSRTGYAPLETPITIGGAGTWLHNVALTPDGAGEDTGTPDAAEDTQPSEDTTPDEDTAATQDASVADDAPAAEDATAAEDASGFPAFRPAGEEPPPACACATLRRDRAPSPSVPLGVALLLGVLMVARRFSPRI